MFLKMLKKKFKWDKFVTQKLHRNYLIFNGLTYWLQHFVAEVIRKIVLRKSLARKGFLRTKKTQESLLK